MFLEVLLYRLCGRWVLDPSNATTSYLRHQQQRTWHQPYLDLLDIDRSTLSELLPSGTALGPVGPELREATGLIDTILVLGAFDHPCAARATGTLRPGQLLLSCGTSWAALYPLTRRDLAVAQGMLVDPFLEPDGPWAGIGALRSIGVNIQWCIDHLIIPRIRGSRIRGPQRRGGPGDRRDTYELFNAAAAAAPLGAGGLFLDPFTELAGDPEQAARIEAAYRPEQIARAVMEGAAFETRRLIEQVADAGLPATAIAMVGGPAESSIWPKIVADVTGLELTLVNGQYAGALGAAALAGIGCGCYRDEQDAFDVLGRQGRIIAPGAPAVHAYTERYQSYCEIRGESESRSRS
jgi:sugar (pentulose or hexulose) kinase